MFYRNFLKPLSDFLISFCALVLFLPFVILLILFLAIANRGDVFFLQQRPGKNQRVFKVIKFKTMNNLKDAEGKLLPDHQRITTVGKFVRSTSLDEIPQLINVLKGDMSLIGPRPLLVKYLPLYSEHQAKRHNVKPGITGWAQVNGRNAISWNQKFDYDVWYIENLSFKLDLKIIILTLKKVVVREGISSETSVTTESFTGNN